MQNQAPFFTISEFSKRARITVRTLRFYEELELLVPTQKNNAGHRLYGLTELAKLQQIQSLKFIGYSLQEIKTFVGNSKDVSTQWPDLIHLFFLLEAYVVMAMEKEKTINWAVLNSLLFQIEHEQDQLEWVKEYISEEIANEFFSLSKEQQQHMEMEMLDWLAGLKKLIKEGVSPESPEAVDILIKLTELATRHVDNKEALAEQLEKAQQLVEEDDIDFKFPTFLTAEEENYLEKIGKSMEALYYDSENLGE